jgi:uncharacterized protein (TIGR03083 family)
MVLEDLLRDLAAESDDLELLLMGLTPDQWRTPTPAPGWSIAHQIAHLAWTDEAAVLAATDAEGFAAVLADAVAIRAASPTTPRRRGPLKARTRCCAGGVRAARRWPRRWSPWDRARGCPGSGRR